MQKYREKSAVFEAMQISTDTSEVQHGAQACDLRIAEIFGWLGARGFSDSIRVVGDRRPFGVDISMNDGLVIHAVPGDYIAIRPERGIHVFAPEHFEDRFEAVSTS